jgi:hypothetical protein
LRGGRTGAVGRNNDGPNVGMGQPMRALREALATVPMTGLATETVGLAASAWPSAWIGAFSDDPRGLATGATYLRTVAPIFGFFRIGYALYCAGEGTDRMERRATGGCLRAALAVLGGALSVHVGAGRPKLTCTPDGSGISWRITRIRRHNGHGVRVTADLAIGDEVEAANIAFVTWCRAPIGSRRTRPIFRTWETGPAEPYSNPPRPTRPISATRLAALRRMPRSALTFCLAQ